MEERYISLSLLIHERTRKVFMNTLFAIVAPSLFVLGGGGLIILLALGLQKLFHFRQSYVLTAIYITLTVIISSLVNIVLSQFHSTKSLAPWSDVVLLLLGAYLTVKIPFKKMKEENLVEPR